ncbi:MAG: DUF4837 family protein [Longimicrobiales bacterium]|nr:DUF4837 family protein [Longimicrobiales bacterium]
MRYLSFLTLAGLLLPLAGCDRTGAYGDASSIVTAMDAQLWAQVDDEVLQALEPTIRTVAEERKFTVTYQDPRDPTWGRLQQFKQLLLVGTGSEPWMADVVRRLDGDGTQPRPRIAQVRDVWARSQLVTVVLLPEQGDRADAFRGQLETLGRIYDRQFRDLALARMFITGRDSALADTLARTAGFSLLVPQVYQWSRRDSVFVFRNDNPDPSELIRQVTVTWRTPIPRELEGEEILAWRAELAALHYAYPQAVDLSQVDAEPFHHEGLSAYQVQAVWHNPPEASWPAAGPFLLWAVACPAQNRLYLLDAWLYAPGREKYEYMIQLQTILESFRCGS